MDLLKRRAEIVADHQAQEKYDPHWKAEAEKGRKISERPIAFVCDDEIRIFGDCAAKVYDALAAWQETAGLDEASAERARTQPAFAQAARVVANVLAGGVRPGPDAAWAFTQQKWNAVTLALGEAGLHVVLADGTHGGG